MLDFEVKTIIDAINGSKGSITEISKRLGCAWSIAKKYIEKHQETKQALQDEIEKNIDKAENVVLASIDEGDIQSAKWFLGTIGKNRGYSEKHEVSHELKGTILKKLSEEFFEQVNDK